MWKRNTGVTLLELLVTLSIVGVVMAGILGTFVLQSRLYMSQGQMAEMEDNLRFGADFIADMLRTAGYGVPCDNMDLWIPWMGGFTENPDIAAGPPDAFSVASGFEDPVAALSLDASAGDTEISLDDTSALDTSSRRLILIGDTDNAHIVSVGTPMTIDTDPTVAGNQGLSRAYLVGTPVRRIDVRTVSVVGNTLVLNDNQGAGAQDLVIRISNLTVDPIAGDQYEVTLTGQVEVRDAAGESLIERSLIADVSMRNDNGCNGDDDDSSS